MKRLLILSVCAVTLLSGCGTYAGSGAYVGASFGSVIGSAIGGISGGWRGSDIGTLVGMAGGAVVGGAIGAQTDKAQQRQMACSDAAFDQKYAEHRSAATGGDNYTAESYRAGADDSGYDPTGSGDDTLYDFQSSDYTGNYTAVEPAKVTPSVRYDAFSPTPSAPSHVLEVRNARFVDDNQDGALNPEELCKIIFEVYNQSDAPLYDVQPTVIETTGNKHIMISGSIHVERLNPRRGVRYTAMVKAGRKLKGNNVVFRLSAAKGSDTGVSNVMEFDIPVKRN